MQLPAAKASDPRPKKCWLLTLHPPVSACRMVTCVTPCQCLTLLSDPRIKSRKMQLPAAKASDPRPKKCWLLTLHPPVSACRMVTCVTPCQCLTLFSDPRIKSRKMQLPAAKATRSKTPKMLAPNASSPCQRVSNGYLCHPLPVPNVAFWPENKIKKNAAARGQSQRSKTQKMLAPNASSPCQRVSNGYLCHPLPVPNVAFWPENKIKKNAAARGQSHAIQDPKNMLAPNASSPCQRVSNGYLCHPLPVPNVAFWPENKIKKNAAARGQSQRSKTQNMLAPNASSPCRRVSNGYLCHPLPVPNVAFWPENKIKKNAAARGQSQRSKTQKMLAPNASSPCQRVSNGYLCHPLPVPNVAFWPENKIKKNAAARGQSQRSKTQKMLAPTLVPSWIYKWVIT